MVKVEVKGLDTFLSKCHKVNDIYPQMANAFMDGESNKLIKECKNASPYATFRKRWYKKSKRKNKADFWRGVFNKAPHLHLVRNGHKMIGHKPDKKDTGKYVEGKDFLKGTLSQFENSFERDMEMFLEGIF